MRGLGHELAAIAVAVGVVVGATLVWASLPPSPRLDCSSSGEHLGSGIAFTPPAEQQVGMDHWYNSTAQSSTQDVRLQNLEFQIQTTKGALVSAGPAWAFSARNLSGAWIAYSYGSTTGNWTTTSTVTMLPGWSFDLLASPDRLSCDVWVVFITGTGVSGCPLGGAVALPIA